MEIWERNVKDTSSLFELRTANLIAAYNSPNLLQYLDDAERIELEKTILERTGLRDA